MKFLKHFISTFFLTFSILYSAEPILVEANTIMAGQETVSFTVCRNVSQNTFRRSAGYDITEDTLNFTGYDGRSPFLTPFKVIATPMGFDRRYILVDGHHTLRGTLDLVKRHAYIPSDIKVPVLVDHSYEDLTPDDFWCTLKEKGLVYLGGKDHLPCLDIMGLPNNEMRAFLDAVVVSYGPNHGLFYANVKPDLALWVRIGAGSDDSSIPFIEYYMAEALEVGGFQYDPTQPITADIVKQALDILRTSKNAQSMKLICHETGMAIFMNTSQSVGGEYEAFKRRLPKKS